MIRLNNAQLKWPVTLDSPRTIPPLLRCARCGRALSSREPGSPVNVGSHHGQLSWRKIVNDGFGGRQVPLVSSLDGTGEGGEGALWGRGYERRNTRRAPCWCAHLGFVRYFPRRSCGQQGEGRTNIRLRQPRNGRRFERTSQEVRKRLVPVSHQRTVQGWGQAFKRITLRCIPVLGKGDASC